MTKDSLSFLGPPMTWAVVECAALNLLGAAHPLSLKAPCPTPVDQLFEGRLRPLLDVEYVVAEIGRDEAHFDCTSNEIVLNPRVYEALLDGDGRARFTVAHEIGHVCLHRDYMRNMSRSRTGELIAKRSQVPAYRDPEAQANVFASEFLLPSRHVLTLARQGANVLDIASLFKTSVRAAEIKLKKVKQKAEARGLLAQPSGF